MPFGSSISCAHFQAFSNAIAHVMRVKTNKDNVNYLDDFLFIALMSWLCNQQVQIFLDICEKIRFPVSMEKMCYATKIITFLGMLIDTVNQLVLIPQDKIIKALEQIDGMLKSKKRKTTIVQIPFLMRLYGSLSGFKTRNNKLRNHHHVKLAIDTVLDLQVWKMFLNLQKHTVGHLLTLGTLCKQQ